VFFILLLLENVNDSKSTSNSGNMDEKEEKNKKDEQVEKESKKEKTEDKKDSNDKKQISPTSSKVKQQSTEGGLSVGAAWLLFLIFFSLIALSFPVYRFIRQTTTFKNLRAPGTIVQYANSNNFHFHCSGEGSPTVFLEPPIGYGHYFYSSVQSLISQFTRVCTYDPPGVGFSEHLGDSSLSLNDIIKLGLFFFCVF
jgi:hypothetical protein